MKNNIILYIDFFGEVAEWINATVLKTVKDLLSFQGSNPCLSFINYFFYLKFIVFIIFFLDIFFMKFRNIPNILTLLRICLIPIFVLFFYLPFNFKYIATSFIFFLASITDLLDGYLARKLDQISIVGTFLDPIADKLIVIVSLTLLISTHGTFLLTFPSLIIIFREILISSLREFMNKLGKGLGMKVLYLSKIKTVFQMISIFILLSQPPLLINKFVIFGYFLFYISTLLTLVSMCFYLKVFWYDIKYEKNKY